jgi:hypothetical protein
VARHSFFKDGQLVSESHEFDEAKKIAALLPDAEWKIDGSKVNREAVRTDQEIIEQTNELARRFSRLQGYEAPEGHKFYEDGGDHMPCPWLLACVAQEFLTGTDPDDALGNLGG